MGKCLFGGGLGEVEGVIIKVITSTSGIMELYPPITAACITDEFPGHAIFPCHDLFWKHLSHHQHLLPGKSYYYLLPLNATTVTDVPGRQIVGEGHVRSNSIPTSQVSSYRMSCDYQGTLKRSYTEIFSRYNSNSTSGFRKVNLVISPQQLLEILSQEGRTQELIESVRTVAKCGNGVLSVASSVAFLDQCSLCSGSRNGSCKKDYLLEIV